MKSVVLCERFFARVSSASRVVKIKASSFLSSPKNSEKNKKKCAVERARRWLFLLFFGLCFLLFSFFGLFFFLFFFLSFFSLSLSVVLRFTVYRRRTKTNEVKKKKKSEKKKKKKHSFF